MSIELQIVCTAGLHATSARKVCTTIRSVRRNLLPAPSQLSQAWRTVRVVRRRARAPPATSARRRAMRALRPADPRVDFTPGFVRTRAAKPPTADANSSCPKTLPKRALAAPATSTGSATWRTGDGDRRRNAFRCRCRRKWAGSSLNLGCELADRVWRDVCAARRSARESGGPPSRTGFVAAPIRALARRASRR